MNLVERCGRNRREKLERELVMREEEEREKEGISKMKKTESLMEA